MQKLGRMLVWVWLSLMVSGEALAAPAAITGSCAPLFTPNYGTCAPNDTRHIFSGFVCNYETIVADIFSQMYCAVQEASVGPLSALLSLFVVVVGAAILIGAVPFTKKDIFLAVARIALLIAFATRADFLVGILYNGVMGFIQQGVEIVMRTADPAAGTGGGVLTAIDSMLNRFLGSAALESATSADDGNPCNDNPIKLFITIFFTAPPIFLLGVATALKLVMVFLRTIVGYLFAVTVIMFLIVLAPIFLGAGLFQATRHLFAQWAKHLISLAVQVVVVFAFIGFVLSMGIEEDFAKLINLGVPITPDDNLTTWQEGARVSYQGICTFASGYGANLQQTDPTPISPDSLFAYGGLLKLLTMETMSLLLLAYLIEAVLNIAPDVAKHLAGLPTAPAIGKVANEFTGVSALQNMGNRMQQSYNNTSGSVLSRSRAAGGTGLESLVRGGTDEAGRRTPSVLSSALQDMLGRP